MQYCYHLKKVYYKHIMKNFWNIYVFLNIHIDAFGFIFCMEIIDIFLVHIFHTEFASIFHHQYHSLFYVSCFNYIQKTIPFFVSPNHGIDRYFAQCNLTLTADKLSPLF